jgi:hypothetical protein
MFDALHAYSWCWYMYLIGWSKMGKFDHYSIDCYSKLSHIFCINLTTAIDYGVDILFIKRKLFEYGVFFYSEIIKIGYGQKHWKHRFLTEYFYSVGIYSYAIYKSIEIIRFFFMKISVILSWSNTKIDIYDRFWAFV